MEVVKQNVTFKFTEDDIKAIKRTKDILDRMTDEMDYERDKINLNYTKYAADDLTDECYRFLYDFTEQLSKSNVIEVIEY